MPFYQSVKTMKAAAIGTIMPWTGALSQIPEGWIICSGGTVAAADYPLLARAIQDNYGTASTSTFGGQFPSYEGDIGLPALTGKPLLDVETSYFGVSGTGHPQDTPALAQSEITPFIGANSDNGFSSTINNVVTDVKFVLDNNQTYAGKLRGNTVVQGSGEASRTMFFGPRKLGRSHIKSHKHGGRNIETISELPAARPGEGVVPYADVTYNFTANIGEGGNFPDGTDRPFNPGPQGDFGFFQWQFTGSERGVNDGWGSGPTGRVIGAINAESPPINWTPRECKGTPIKGDITEPSNIRTFQGVQGGAADKNVLMATLQTFDAGVTGSDNAAGPLKYGPLGLDLPIPNGQSNFYPDLLYTPGKQASNVVAYDTLMSNPGWNFEITTPSTATQDQILSHTHDEFDVTFDKAGLKPDTSLNVTVEAVTGTLNLDNDRNVGVLQIDMNISQPGMSCIYLIRAY